jgi:hypothetical protein
MSTNIAQLFANFDDFAKPKSINDTATTYLVNNTTYTSPSPALRQGEKFKRYQWKIQNNLEKQINKVNTKEGYQGLQGLQLNGNGLTAESNQRINQNELIESNNIPPVDKLKKKYKNTISEYENIQKEIKTTTLDYLERVDNTDPYLNKVVEFQTGEYGYVTNMGVFKYIPYGQSLGSIPGYNNRVSLNVPWKKEYSTPGYTIPTTPSLITGTPVQEGQALGNEGTNIYVNSLITNPKSSYVGCYADNTTSPLMTFIGPSPPLPTAIINGNFAQPQIADNTYQYLNSNTDILGWYFNAVLVNQSTAWGYPMPYPNGPQCACIQGNGQSMYQTINLTANISYTLAFYACNRPNYTGNSLTVQLQNSNYQADIFYNLNPPITWTNYSTNFTVPTTENYNIYFLGTNGDGNIAIQDIQLSIGSLDTASYTYNECQQAAINNEYQYFALQDVNTETGYGYCAVSNDEPTITSLGESYIPSEQIILWSTNTSGQTGNIAILNNSGSLSVINSSGSSVYSTSVNSNETPTNYIGCYKSNPPSNNLNSGNYFNELYDALRDFGHHVSPAPTTPAMNMYNNGAQSYDLASCQQIAQQQNASLFALQNSNTGTNAQCLLSSDFSTASEYGNASNCTQISNGSWSGGAWSNAIYNTTNPSSNYFLILTDNGECCIYRGTGPYDIQGLLWTASLSQSVQSANPKYAASQGTYGQNWIPSGSTLAPGDFVGSPSGNLVLIMQADGNLVLCTYQMQLNCNQMTSNKMGGGVGANAIYNIGQVGIQANMSQLAYIDQNSELHPYPSSNTQYSDTYTLTPNMAINGTYVNSEGSVGTLEQCENACNNNSECIGFNFNTNVGDPGGGMCLPMSSNSGTYEAQGINMFARNLMPLNPPVGVPTVTNNVDSIQYGNYLNGGNLGKQYGLAAAISGEEKQSQQVGSYLDNLSKKITDVTKIFYSGSENTESQSQKNVKGIAKYLYDIKKTNNMIQDYSSNVDNILQNSDIVVLQKNYNYLLWSILAIATILIAINVVKK